MATLPSYQEATSRSDWLEIAAPYFSIRDYARLCRVSRSFHGQFAARLWNDPLKAARLLGLHPNFDLDWYFRFMYQHVRTVRRDVLKLVTCLDFRGFAIGTSDFFSDTSERSIVGSFRTFPSVFPNLRCIQLDGHPEFDPAALVKPLKPDALGEDDFEPPLFLSMVQCGAQLPNNFFDAGYLRSLLYLDVSDIPGSLRSALTQGSLRPSNLPSLRILKARGREMDDSTAILLFTTFMDRIWSLDLSRNNLTDYMITSMISHSFPAFTLQNDSHFETEGKLTAIGDIGNDEIGSFRFIEESEWSGTFSHPDRYLVDSPAYYPNSDRPPQEALHLRSDGRAKLRPYEAEDIKRAVAGNLGSPIPHAQDVYELDICQGHGGITHLSVNDNNLTALGLEKMFRISGGHLEHFECESVSVSTELVGLPSWVSKSARVRGILGLSHLFRPVIASNLRSLRIHHSLVTQTLTIENGGATTMTNIWLSEAFLHKRAELAYPQGFVPDMNPRLQFLALTNIPRHSTGPLIEKLIRFLELAHRQEQGIFNATVSSRRSPSLVRGLRHIRLEFEPDPSEELASLAESTQLDAEALMSSSADDFSFFGDEKSPAADKSTPTPALTQPPPTPRKPLRPESGTLSHYPFSETQGDYVQHFGHWNGKALTIPVWVGNGVLGAHAAVNEYMANLADARLRADVRPVTPGHVIAGVPPGSYIFNAAWDAMFACDEMRKPSPADLREMKDVMGAIRRFRAETKVAYEIARRSSAQQVHKHWTGTLELVLKRSAAQFHESKYWR